MKDKDMLIEWIKGNPAQFEDRNDSYHNREQMLNFAKHYALNKGQTLPIDSVIICSRVGCNNEREKEHSYCLDCRYERTMSGY